MGGPEEPGDAAPPSERAGYLNLSEEWGGGDAEATTEASRPEPAASETQPLQHASRPHDPDAADVARGKKIRGVARSIDVRVDESEQQRLTFRIDRYDVAGNRLTPVPVEVRRYRGGLITEGDEVEVSGRWSHGTLRATRIVNKTTESEVRSWFPRGAKWVGLALLLVLAVIAGAIVAVVLLSDTAGGKTVPNVTGQSEAAATAALKDAGLTPVSQTEPSDAVTAGNVIRTEPPAGFPVPKNDSVTLVVSSGPPTAATAPVVTVPPNTAPPTTAQPPSTPAPVTIPGVSGDSQSDATQTLEQLGLTVQVVQQSSAAVPAGTAIGTDPAEGATVPAGGTVKLFVSSGP